MSGVLARQTDLASLVPEDAIDAAFCIASLNGWTKIEQVGQGAFGDVWKYTTPKEETPYAAGKQLRVQLWNLNEKQKEDLKKRSTTFIREVEVMTTVSSECRDRLVQFIGYYLDSKKLILFTEWMPNGSVKNHIINHPLDEPTALKYIFQATEGLHFLHHYVGGRNVHRDIKCENLLLTSDNQVKLADFGLAHGLMVDSESYTLSQSAPNGRHGTIIFSAPEVLIEETYGRRADIWSLGCTLVEMLTCQPPHADFWARHNERATFLFLEQARAVPAHQLPYKGCDLAPDASPTIHKLLDCLFTRNKDHRPRSEEVLSIFTRESSSPDAISIDLAKLDELQKTIKRKELSEKKKCGIA